MFIFCSKCGGDLDTGYRCIKCGAHEPPPQDDDTTAGSMKSSVRVDAVCAHYKTGRLIIRRPMSDIDPVIREELIAASERKSA